MGKVIQFPCRDHYEEYEDYYGEEEYNCVGCGSEEYVEFKKEDGCFRGFVRKILFWILIRL